MGPRIGRGLGSLMGAALATWLAVGGLAHGQVPPVPLECQVGQGSWQACQMEIVEPGTHWFLTIGKRRLEFRHGGTGRMRMGQDGRWREVTPQWRDDRSLCWDGVCVRGEIPLD
ncbi:MAG: hypothetical protein VKP70_11965 [Cyanobacteriota bacterium]|nr:hypothetical protein [Cyanobacteriota bacterium]